MNKEKSNKPWWELWGTHTSLLANVFTILGFLGFGTLATWVAVFRPGNAAQRVQNDTKTITVVTDTSRGYVNPPFSDSNKLHRPVLPPKGSTTYVPIDSAGNVQDSARHPDFYVSVLDSNSGSKELSGSYGVITVETTFPPIPTGEGRLALRSYCDHCAETFVWVSIYHSDSSYVYDKTQRLFSKYDSLRKKLTTYIADLPPGEYIVKLGYQGLGMHYTNVTIKEGHTSLYRFRKINPFGKGNGSMLFVSALSKRNWSITIDKNYLGVVTLGRDTGFAITVPTGYRQYLIQKQNPGELDYNDEKRTIFVGEGQQIKIAIK
jgi:hypothetical protein